MVVLKAVLEYKVATQSSLLLPPTTRQKQAFGVTSEIIIQRTQDTPSGERQQEAPGQHVVLQPEVPNRRHGATYKQPPFMATRARVHRSTLE